MAYDISRVTPGTGTGVNEYPQVSAYQEPAGTDITLSLPEDSDYMLLAGDFGFSDTDDNNFASVIITTAPSQGMLTLDGVPVTGGQSVAVSALTVGAGLVFTPSADGNGVGYASLTFQVVDDGGTASGGQDTDQSPNTMTFDVTPVNDDPIAAGDSVTTDEDMPVTTPDVTANDSDVDGDPILPIRFTQGSSGVVTSNMDGTFNYAPFDDFNGTDSFTYTISDGNGGEAVGTVNVTVNPVTDDIVAVDDAFTVQEDSTDFLANGYYLTDNDQVDPDIHPLDLGVQIVSGPGNGVVSIGDLGPGSVGYYPNADFNGTDTFTYRTTVFGQPDVDSSVATVTVTVEPVNDAPVAVDDAVTTDENTPVTTPDVTANDTDVDGDPLLPISYTQAGNGAVTSNMDGTFNYAPGADFFGSDSFTYTISDGNGGEATGTVNVTVNEVPDEPAGPIRAFLVDTTTDEVILELTEGLVIDAALVAGRQVSMYAEADPSLGGTRAIVNLDGQYSRFEGVQPYALFGDLDMGGGTPDFLGGIELTEGAHTFSTDVYGNGLVGELEVNFSVGQVAEPDGSALFITTGTVSLTEGDAGATVFTYTVNRTGDLSEATSVLYGINGTGANPTDASDFTGPTSGTVSFAAGESSADITINVQGDTDEEANEQFTVALSDSEANATITQGTAQGTIVNDDIPAPEPGATQIFLVDTATDQVIVELTEGLVIDASLVAGRQVSIFALADPALGGNRAFVKLDDGPVRFEGQSPYSLFGDRDSVSPIDYLGGTTLAEGDHVFSFDLYGNGLVQALDINFSVGQNTEPGTSALSITPATVSQAEGDAGATAVTFTVNRTGDLSEATSVLYGINGTGANPTDAADFTGPTSGTVSFAAGESSADITINVQGDTDVEANEQFTVTLSDPEANATIVQASAQGTILDDDAPPPLSLTVSPQSQELQELDSVDSSFVYLLSRSGGDIGAGLTVDFALLGAGANPVDATDFGGWLPTGSIYFAPGQESLELEFPFTSDTDPEADEGFALTFTANDSSNATAQASGTILDDDTPEVSPISVYLVNTDSDEDIQEIVDGSVVNISQVSGGNVSVYALVDPSLDPSHALLLLDGASPRTEGVQPYALFGDIGDNDFQGGTSLGPGAHTFSIDVYGRGGTLIDLDITFSVVDDVVL